ncbi:hypothetical protein M5689_004901 [Euphorbia peplus]|nr:hypothetical protein M5689_004901 [Euphorbia peplus]
MKLFLESQGENKAPQLKELLRHLLEDPIKEISYRELKNNAEACISTSRTLKAGPPFNNWPLKPSDLEAFPRFEVEVCGIPYWLLFNTPLPCRLLIIRL